MDGCVSPPVFDGHNDLLLRLWVGGNGIAPAIDGRDGHIDVAKARAGGFGGGFFAVFVSSDIDPDEKSEAMNHPAYDLPLPEPIAWDVALPVALGQMRLLYDLERAGAVTICRTAADIRATLGTDRMAAILHIEGAEAIDPDLAILETFHRAGLRSLGPVWSRANIFGHGVPFRFPSDPDTGPGLTDAGQRLVRECNRLRIAVDLSHLNAAGFRDVARISDAPLIATHSNAHALTPHSRNLTDWQLDAIKDSNGMVGLNFAVAFLRPDGQMRDTGLDPMLAHLDTLIGRLGEDRVGLGSDFDGALVPSAIGTAAGLPALRDAMKGHGYTDALMAKLCHGNWLRVLELTWGA